MVIISFNPCKGPGRSDNLSRVTSQVLMRSTLPEQLPSAVLSVISTHVFIPDTL